MVTDPAQRVDVRPGHTSHPLPHNLPAPPTALIERDLEVALIGPPP